MANVRWSEVPEVDGLHRLDVQWVGGRVDPKVSARALFEAVLTRFPSTRFTVDLRLPELADAELFDRSDHRSFEPGDGALDRIRASRGTLRTATTCSVEELIEEVVEDTGWFSVGGYGLLLDDRVLIDRFRDGIHAELYVAA